MDFSTAHFGKQLDTLEFNDIVSHFTEPRRETETIEFKSYHAQATFDKGLQNVIRGISAFLNSSGGILIWGAPAGQKLQGFAEDVFVGDLSPVTELHGKDRLINRITSAIVPLPIGIKVSILESNGVYVYVFEVQPSMYKPHQYDTRYYVRLDGQTKPAPHYLIDALMKQITYPNLNGVIRFTRITLDQDEVTINFRIGIFNLSPLQNEESVSIRVTCNGGIFQKVYSLNIHLYPQKYNGGLEMTYNNFIDTLHFGIPATYDDVITTNDSQLSDYNDKLTITLTFGGKRSPAKYSRYTLNFGKQFTLSNPNSAIEDYVENVLYSEESQHMNEMISQFTRR